MHDTTRMQIVAFWLAICSVGVTALPALAEWEEEQFSPKNSDADTPRRTSSREIREAVGRAVQLVDRTSAKFLDTRKCFTCHTQTLSVIVLSDARGRGLKIDEGNLKRQFERALTLHGELNGIRVDTVGHGLWALDVGKYAPDEKTKDMVAYLLNYQPELGIWETTVNRPPTEASLFTTNYVAIRGLNRFGTDEQKAKIASRKAAVKNWLKTADAVDTEDKVYRLRLVHELKGTSKRIHALVEQLLGEQLKNGGWAQKSGMMPDAYATASVMVALHEAGKIASDHPTWTRGIRYLVDTQTPDGSWYVKTRTKPIQVYFESGFPHGRDQFISAFATGWAAKALLVSLVESK